MVFEKGNIIYRRNAKMGIGLSTYDIDSLLLELDWTELDKINQFFL
jgi:hypothetical protein